MNVLIGGAWPYANGSLHVGHVAALLPGDVLARYYRLKNVEVCYVSGSDCHGTPIQVRATREGVTPSAIANRYHEEFKDCFERLGFSYDVYSQTTDEAHKQFVQQFFHALVEKGFVYPKTVEQAYCGFCQQFLPDRFVVGTCPDCGSGARGDQCDHCGKIVEPIDLHNRRCSICGDTPTFRESEQFYFALSTLQKFIETYVDSATGWRENAYNLSRRYIEEGLIDRAVTRDLDWGIPVPISGFQQKKIYVWVEAVLGYLSASQQWTKQHYTETKRFWSDDSLHYYVHGKDNIPFHTVILPALLEAHGDYHLPDRIVSSEYVTLEGKKLSTSKNWAVWVPDLLQQYHPDSIRYFLIANGPEKRDGDFSWREFIHSHNGELLGAFGNFVNRNLVFIQKSFDGRIPNGTCELNVSRQLEEVYDTVGALIEEGRFKEALETIFTLIRFANKFFDDAKPWVTVKGDRQGCADTLYTCVQIIGNLSILLSPFLPFSAKTIQRMLSITEEEWQPIVIEGGLQLEHVEVLFERIEKERIAVELGKLKETLSVQR